MNQIPIFLLHGLGSHTITFLPLVTYLKYKGYTTHAISYPVDKLSTIKESVDYVDQQISQIIDKNTEIIVIGQSMGGVIANNLHTKGYLIKKAIYIGSPLHGANLLNQLERTLPTFIRNYFNKPPYDILKDKQREEEPPHDYNTISMGWFNSDFDGCVYKNETMLDSTHHKHFSYADHRTFFANPRLWLHVHKLVDVEV